VPQATSISAIAAGSPTVTRVEGEFSGFPGAAILQHETDHLDGIVYLDRMRDLATLGAISQKNAIRAEAAHKSDAARLAIPTIL